MKFVQKDQGAAAENSSGGGMEGFFKEALFMLIAYWVMAVSIVAVIVAVIALLVMFLAQ